MPPTINDYEKIKVSYHGTEEDLTVQGSPRP